MFKNSKTPWAWSCKQREPLYFINLMWQSEQHYYCCWMPSWHVIFKKWKLYDNFKPCHQISTTSYSCKLAESYEQFIGGWKHLDNSANSKLYKPSVYHITELPFYLFLMICIQSLAISIQMKILTRWSFVWYIMIQSIAAKIWFLSRGQYCFSVQRQRMHHLLQWNHGKLPF